MEDICYAAGIRDAENYILTRRDAYTGPSGELSMNEVYAYMDGRTYVLNRREVIVP